MVIFKDKLVNEYYENSVRLDIEIIRAIEQAVEALARLDERVRSLGDGLPTLLRLRSAQAIVAANDRPPEPAPDDSKHAQRQAPVPDGDDAFAALLGWWYAPTSREIIADDPHLRGVALALDAMAGKMRSGCALTSGALDEAFTGTALETLPRPDLLEATLSVAVHESWPALLVAADLSAGACGRLRSISASVARAVAPLASGVTTDVFVVAPVAEDETGALHAIAEEARAVRRCVDIYADETGRGVDECGSLGRGGPSAAALVRLFAKRPAMTVAGAVATLGLSAPTAGAAMDRLVKAELLREVTGRKRDRVFVYTPAVTLAG